jgi:hypothetical protein
MRSFLVNFAGLAAMAFLQIHCQAGIVKAQTSTVIFFLVHETGFG